MNNTNTAAAIFRAFFHIALLPPEFPDIFRKMTNPYASARTGRNIVAFSEDFRESATAQWFATGDSARFA
jgi:hypothetical protein